MFDYESRNLVATVVFVDIEAYSKLAVSGQVTVKTRFNEMINESLAGVALNERILLDTGDGAALCFLGDPEHGLHSARSLCNGAKESIGDSSMALRIGVNMGPIQLIKDFNGQPNVIGDAINTAQRIMSFASANQILVSRSFYELVSCLKPEYGQIFNHLGTRQDKHTRAHEVYAIRFPGESCAESGNVESAGSPPEREAPPAIIPIEELSELEKIFAKYMGPIAKVLIRKTSRVCVDRNQLYQQLADNISAVNQRADFLREISGLNMVQATTAAPLSIETSPPTESSGNSLVASQISAVESRLAMHIGPMAKFLVRRALCKCGNLAELCHDVAQHIENDRDRESFLSILVENTP